MTFGMEADVRAEPGFGSTGGVHTTGIQTPDNLCSSPAQSPSAPTLSNDRSIRSMITAGGEMSRSDEGKALTTALTRSYRRGCSRFVRQFWLPLSRAIAQ